MEKLMTETRPNDKYDGKGKFTDCIGKVYIGDF